GDESSSRHSRGRSGPLVARAPPTFHILPGHPLALVFRGFDGVYPSSTPLPAPAPISVPKENPCSQNGGEDGGGANPRWARSPRRPPAPRLSPLRIACCCRPTCFRISTGRRRPPSPCMRP